MKNQLRIEIHEDLFIGNEQVTSNECWLDDEKHVYESNEVLDDLKIGDEQVTSNECYEEGDK